MHEVALFSSAFSHDPFLTTSGGGDASEMCSLLPTQPQVVLILEAHLPVRSWLRRPLVLPPVSPMAILMVFYINGETGVQRKGMTYQVRQQRSHMAERSLSLLAFQPRVVFQKADCLSQGSGLQCAAAAPTHCLHCAHLSALPAWATSLLPTRAGPSVFLTQQSKQRTSSHVFRWLRKHWGQETFFSSWVGGGGAKGGGDNQLNSKIIMASDLST